MDKGCGEVEKCVTITVMVVIVGLQALHIATFNRGYVFAKYVDDLTSTSYTAYNAVTLAYSYIFGFAMVVAGATILIYLGLIIAKWNNANLSKKWLQALNFAVTLLQFSLAVLVAVAVSSMVDPNGKNANAIPIYSVGNCWIIQRNTKITMLLSSPMPSSDGWSACLGHTSSLTLIALSIGPRRRIGNDPSFYLDRFSFSISFL